MHAELVRTAAAPKAPDRARPVPAAERPGRCLGAAAQLAAIRRTLAGGLPLELKTEGMPAGQSAAAKAKPPGQAPNRPGLPDRLKAGVEALSGLAMDDVRVHRNSAAPAKLGALAFTRGSDIHLGPGQEQHLPHEAWHVVQQKQGRVRPTVQLKGGTPVNDDPVLEQEADVQGALAMCTLAPQRAPAGRRALRVSPSPGGNSGAPLQAQWWHRFAAWGTWFKPAIRPRTNLLPSAGRPFHNLHDPLTSDPRVETVDPQARQPQNVPAMDIRPDADAREAEAETVTVYRVEGKGNQRLHIDEKGNVGIPPKTARTGEERLLYVNCGDPKRAQEFLAQRHAKGFLDNVIKTFEIPKALVEDLTKAANSEAERGQALDNVSEAKRSNALDRPVIADPSKAKLQFGLPKTWIELMRRSILPGSGRPSNDPKE